MKHRFLSNSRDGLHEEFLDYNDFTKGDIDGNPDEFPTEYFYKILSWE
jgi:hypothetical protein